MIDEVGVGVGSWQVGDPVVATPWCRPARTAGAYADQVVVPAASVVRLPEDIEMTAASTVLMNALTARLALRELDLAPGRPLAVTGAAGASEKDEALVRGFGADDVVRRGDDVVKRIREVAPDGVDGLADGAVLDGLVLAAVRDGGGVATVRGWSGPSERDIAVHPIMVFGSADAHRLLEAGGVRGRMVLDFSS